MQRKAQVTLFLIIGIAIILGLGYTMYNAGISKRAKVTVETEKLNSLKLQINPLNNFMSRCVNDILKNTLDSTGLSAQKLADELKTQVQTSCDLQSFQERGIEIEAQLPEVQVEIKHNQLIIVRLKYPLTLKDKEETLTIKDFATSLPLKTVQPLVYDPVNPGQTQQPTQVLSSDGKTRVEIAPGTQFLDADGNVIIPAQVGVTIQDNPQTPTNPNDKPSQVYYQLQLFDTAGNPLPVTETLNPTNPNPVKITYYTEDASSSPVSYAYQDDPLNPGWEVLPYSTITEELRSPTFKQEQKIQELSSQILSSPTVQAMDPTQKSLVQQELASLQTNPQKTTQEQNIEALQSQVPSSAVNHLKAIFQTTPITLQTVTVTETSDLKQAENIKKSTATPQQPPQIRTDEDIKKTVGFEGQTTATDVVCDTVGATCCPGNLCRNDLHCENGACQACTPNCFELDHNCGDDGCGRACGVCEAGHTCREGRCVQDTTTPICGDGACENPESCSTCNTDCGCPYGQECEEGICQVNTEECTPQCTFPNLPTALCGFPDGCGGLCNGLCPTAGLQCNQGQCTTNMVCTPNCEGKRCGEDNGCGGGCTVFDQSCSNAQPYCLQGKCNGFATNVAALYDTNLQKNLATANDLS